MWWLFSKYSHLLVCLIARYPLFVYFAPFIHRMFTALLCCYYSGWIHILFRKLLYTFSLNWTTNHPEICRRLTEQLPQLNHRNAHHGLALHCLNTGSGQTVGYLWYTKIHFSAASSYNNDLWVVVFFLLFVFFVHLIYLKHVSISEKVSPCEMMQIGNDIHFDLECHIVVQTEVLQS